MKENYPAFEKWYTILGWILDRCEGFPKSLRFSIAERITGFSLDVLEQIVEAIYNRKRKGHLQKINLHVEKLRLFFRLSHDRKYISMKQYEYISTELDGFGRMVGGWIKSCSE